MLIFEGYFLEKHKEKWLREQYNKEFLPPPEDKFDTALEPPPCSTIKRKKMYGCIDDRSPPIKKVSPMQSRRNTRLRKQRS